MSMDTADPEDRIEADDGELSDEASIEDALEGFSLDDFSEDDLDSLGEDEPK